MQLQPKKFMLKNDNMKKSSPQVIRDHQVEHNKARKVRLLTRYSKLSMTRKLRLEHSGKQQTNMIYKLMVNKNPRMVGGSNSRNRNQNLQGLPRREEKCAISNPSLWSLTAKFQSQILMRKIKKNNGIMLW